MIVRIAASLLPCPLCGPDAAARPAGPLGACPACTAALGQKAAVAVDGDVDLAWLAPYQGRALRAVRAIKFGGRLTLARTVGRRLGRYVACRGWRVARVVPVPLHRRRRWRRGYDQADRLAQGVAEALAVPLSRSLVRVRATDRQARAGADSRGGNVAGAFRAASLPPVPVLLVDDVWTTGATARACRDALRAAGARAVLVAVVARAGAPPHSHSTVAVATPRIPPTSTWG